MKSLTIMGFTKFITGKSFLHQKYCHNGFPVTKLSRNDVPAAQLLPERRSGPTRPLVLGVIKSLAMMVLNTFPHPFPSLSPSHSARPFSTRPLPLAAKRPVTAADGVFSFLDKKPLHLLRHRMSVLWSA